MRSASTIGARGRPGTASVRAPLRDVSAGVRTATIAFVGSVVLAIALLVAVALLTHWILGKAFLPVSRMTEDAADWSDHDLNRRFNRGEPYDELTRLAATLDALLERLSASLRHEQRFTAELSHELRTPLARIAAETELALRRERTADEYRSSLGAVRRNAEQMARTVEALVSAARQKAGLNRATSDVRDGITAAAASVNDEAVANRTAITVDAPRPRVGVAIEADLVERIVHPLLDNAVRYGRSRVSVVLETNAASATIHVNDDGVGVLPRPIRTVADSACGCLSHDHRLVARTPAAACLLRPFRRRRRRTSIT